MQDKLKGEMIGTECFVLVPGLKKTHSLKSHPLGCPCEGMAGEIAAVAALKKEGGDAFRGPVIGEQCRREAALSGLSWE